MLMRSFVVIRILADLHQTARVYGEAICARKGMRVCVLHKERVRSVSFLERAHHVLVETVNKCLSSIIHARKMQHIDKVVSVCARNVHH